MGFALWREVPDSRVGKFLALDRCGQLRSMGKTGLVSWFERRFRLLLVRCFVCTSISVSVLPFIANCS